MRSRARRRSPPLAHEMRCLGSSWTRLRHRTRGASGGARGPIFAVARPVKALTFPPGTVPPPRTARWARAVGAGPAAGRVPHTSGLLS